MTHSIVFEYNTKQHKYRNAKYKGFKLLDFVVVDTISHHTINKCYKLCSIKIVFPKHPYFWSSPNGLHGIVVRELEEIIGKCVIKKLEKYTNRF